jgi:UDP-2,4-diacetamido-2,4,6-trideoxy-beta-L-altropyranose hydrolase
MTRPLAVFRTEASPRTGLGHLIRCAALAELLDATGWDCAFAVSAESAAAAAASLPPQWPVEVLPRMGAAEALAGRFPQGCRLLVVDDYGSGAADETPLRRWAARLLVIDDLANRAHDCDALLDQTPGRDPAAYRGLVPPRCRILAGLSYALLRGQFAALRPAALARRAASGDARHLLVAMGGADAVNHTGMVVDAAASLPLDIDVVIGAAAPHLAAFGADAELSPRIRVHSGVAAIGSLMATADLAVGAAGMSAWERCCLALPSIVLVAAENQREGAAHLAAAGAAIIVAPDEEEGIGDIIMRLAEDAQRRRAMAEAAAALCDGRGAWRALLALLEPVPARDGAAVTLRLAEPADAPIMHEWQIAPETRRHSRNPVPPTLAEHMSWFNKALWDAKRLLTVICRDEAPVGALRFDRRSEGTGFEVSIAIAPYLHGGGIGSAALALARELMPGARLVAEVDPANAASQRIFRKAGFTAVDDRHLHWTAAA